MHLTPDEIHVAHTKGAWIVHNPRSNMNNAVGYAPTAALRRAALGTDGIDGDMLAEARAAYLKMRDSGRGDAMEATLELVAGGHRLGAALFGLPFGKLDAGGPADLVVAGLSPADAAHHRERGRAPAVRDRPQPRALGDGGGAMGGPRSGRGDGRRRGAAAEARVAAAALWERESRPDRTPPASWDQRASPSARRLSSS